MRRLQGHHVRRTSRDVRNRPRDQRHLEPVSGASGARQPFFSPDGRWVAFFARGLLLKASVGGGAPTPRLRTADAGTWTIPLAIKQMKIAFTWKSCREKPRRKTAPLSIDPAQSGGGSKSIVSEIQRHADGSGCAATNVERVDHAGETGGTYPDRFSRGEPFPRSGQTQNAFAIRRL